MRIGHDATQPSTRVLAHAWSNWVSVWYLPDMDWTSATGRARFELDGRDIAPLPPQPLYRFGRLPTQDVRLTLTKAGREHFVLLSRQTDWLLLALPCTNPTMVGGRGVSSMEGVEAGMVILAGGHRIRVLELPPLSADAALGPELTTGLDGAYVDCVRITRVRRGTVVVKLVNRQGEWEDSAPETVGRMLTLLDPARHAPGDYVDEAAQFQALFGRLPAPGEASEYRSQIEKARSRLNVWWTVKFPDIRAALQLPIATSNLFDTRRGTGIAFRRNLVGAVDAPPSLWDPPSEEDCVP